MLHCKLLPFTDIIIAQARNSCTDTSIIGQRRIWDCINKFFSHLVFIGKHLTTILALPPVMFVYLLFFTQNMLSFKLILDYTNSQLRKTSQSCVIARNCFTKNISCLPYLYWSYIICLLLMTLISKRPFGYWTIVANMWSNVAAWRPLTIQQGA